MADKTDEELVVINSISNNSDDDDYVVMLTTIDNPYNPFVQFDEWYAYDELMGYHSCSYLARIAKTSDELSDADNKLAIEQAIDEIVYYNVIGLYLKVTRNSFKDRTKT